MLHKNYSPEFERLYKSWPSWPQGRTKKHLAAKAFDKAKKDFEFTEHDIDELIFLIERMKKERKSWQKGNAYGPQGLQVWLNQAGWQDDYEKVYTRTTDKYDKANEEDTFRPLTPEERARADAAKEEAMRILRRVH
jgi:hypothetical protein